MPAKEFFDSLPGRADADKLAGVSNSYLFDIEGEGQWLVDVRDGGLTVADGGGDADVDDHHLERDVRGHRRREAEPDDRVHDREAEDQGRHGRRPQAAEAVLVVGEGELDERRACRDAVALAHVQRRRRPPS